MVIKHVVFALGFLIVAIAYVEHGVSEMKKAVTVSRDGSSKENNSH